MGGRVSLAVMPVKAPRAGFENPDPGALEGRWHQRLSCQSAVRAAAAQRGGERCTTGSYCASRVLEVTLVREHRSPMAARYRQAVWQDAVVRLLSCQQRRARLERGACERVAEGQILFDWVKLKCENT